MWFLTYASGLIRRHGNNLKSRVHSIVLVKFYNRLYSYNYLILWSLVKSRIIPSLQSFKNVRNVIQTIEDRPYMQTWIFERIRGRVHASWGGAIALSPLSPLGSAPENNSGIRKLVTSINLRSMSDEALKCSESLSFNFFWLSCISLGFPFTVRSWIPFLRQERVILGIFWVITESLLALAKCICLKLELPHKLSGETSWKLRCIFDTILRFSFQKKKLVQASQLYNIHAYW